MSCRLESLSKERQLVLYCSKGALKEEEAARVREMAQEPLDWREILYQGTTHRTLNLIHYHFKNLGIAGRIEEEVSKIMKTQSKVYSIRNKLYFEETNRIYKRLNENGIRAAILKGNFLASAVYPSEETRTFNDLDFLINLKDGPRIVEILEGMGYIQGQYDDKSGEIIPSTRKQKMFHQISTGELQECLKKTDNPFVPLFQVDLNYSILWQSNCPCTVDTSELLERAVPVELDGGEVYILDYEDFLIQLACHLYKEAAILHWIHDMRDLKIYKFADIAMFADKYSNNINWDKLVAFCSRSGSQKVVYYAFHHVNLMYGQVIPENVMNALEPLDKEYLDEYGIENEKPSKWRSDFFTRLFETGRVMEIEGKVTSNFWDAKSSLGG